MQINSTLYTAMATQPSKNGNNLPPSEPQSLPPIQKTPSIRDLVKSIDPTNMSRNDARTIAASLGQAGELELDNAIALQSMVLVNENGNLQTATESDSIMNDKFNMFEVLNSQIEFNKSKGLSTDYLEKGLDFFEKLHKLKENTEINIYA